MTSRCTAAIDVNTAMASSVNCVGLTSIMSTKDAAVALGVIRTRSARNTVTNNQSASDVSEAISSPVIRMLPVVPNRISNIKAVKDTGTCRRNQFHRFTASV